MFGDTDIAAVAALLADPTRASMLLTLSDGRAFTTTELAKSAKVAPSTASEHLSRLVGAGLLAVERQGRHRYYRLAEPAIMETIESLASIAPRQKIHTLSAAERAKVLHYARICYHHLAGMLGVSLADSLVEQGILHVTDAGYVVEKDGLAWLQAFGITLRQAERLYVPWHIDWSERRHHIAGSLGAALANRLFQLRWLERHAASRAVRVTSEGKTQLAHRFGIHL